MKLRQQHSAQPKPTNSFPRLCGAISAAIAITMSGCANNPTQVEPAPPRIQAELPPEPFSTETLYSLMVAELAGSRDRLDIMLNNYVAQAIETQDAGITERAAHLANFMQEAVATQQMAAQWASLAPDNSQARYMAMAALSDAGRYFEAFEHGKYLINHQHSPHGLDALAVKATNSNPSSDSIKTLLKLYSALLESHIKDAELTLAVSFLDYNLNTLEAAMRNAQRAQTLKKDYEQAYLQELRILGKRDADAAQLRLAQIVALFPENQRLRLQYARNLTQTDLGAAALQFETLLKQAPGDNNIQLALALTYYQQDELDSAKTHFLALEHAIPQESTANYYLGKIAQQQEAQLEAIRYYSQVKPSKEFLPALARAVDLMHKNEQQDVALQIITSHQLSVQEEYQEGLSQLLADHYRNVNNPEQAERAFNEGIIRFPRSQTLLFNRAMFLTTLNRLDDAERDLLTVIAIEPNNTDALNSLGYILADANIRLPEALTYIERALAIDPNNAAAIDSLGWALYRQGHHKIAITHLRQALQLMPNDEIAAHLGEVLWVEGQQEEALVIWKQGLKLKPGSRFIMERLKRFQLLDDANS